MLAEKTYRLFLDEIKKEGTATVGPKKFTRIINESMMSVILSKLPQTEVISKRVEDLSQLLITTDGFSPSMGNNPLPPIESSPHNQFQIPRSEEIEVNGRIYPRVLKVLRIAFKLTYIDHECLVGESKGYISAKLLKTDQKDKVISNPHRRPTTGPPFSRFYFQLYGDNLTAIVSRDNVGSYASKMEIEYYRYPLAFAFHGYNQPTNVGIEFNDDFAREIIDHAAAGYLSETGDPRWEPKRVEKKDEENFN